MKHFIYHSTLVILLSILTLAFGQSGTFTFDSGTSTSTTEISQTIDGVTITVTASSNNMFLVNMNEWGSSSNGYCSASGSTCTFFLLSFSSAVNISTITGYDWGGSSSTWTFTPDVGDTKQATVGFAGNTVSLDYTGVTTINITSNISNAAFAVDDIIMDASLPVELVSFNAASKGNTVELQWETASETDNLGFIIERQTEPSNWIQIASYKSDDNLAGQGTTSFPSQYTFTDNNVSAGVEYSYRLSEVSTSGAVNVIGTTSVATTVLPTITQLFAAYPNPFNPATTLNYQLAKDSQVSITVYDILGREVKTLVNSHLAAGEYSAVWDGANVNGETVTSGIYIIHMRAGEYNRFQKITLIK